MQSSFKNPAPTSFQSGEAKWSESHSVVSSSLWPYGLYSPRNSPGQNTGVGSFLFSRESSQPRNWTRSPALQADSLPAEPQGSPRILEWVAYPFFRGSSRSRSQPGSPALRADSLPTELWGKPLQSYKVDTNWSTIHFKFWTQKAL